MECPDVDKWADRLGRRPADVPGSMECPDVDQCADGLGRRPAVVPGAVECPEKENWQHAIRDEYEAIIRNNTFEVTEAKAPAEAISSNGYSSQSASPMTASDIRQDFHMRFE